LGTAKFPSDQLAARERFWAAAIVLVLALPLLAPSVLNYIPDDGNDGRHDNVVALIGAVGTALAVLVAVVTLIVSSTNAARQSRKQHTITILFETRLSEHFQTIHDKRALFFPPYRDVTLAEWRAASQAQPTENNDPAKKVAQEKRDAAKSLQTLLNYWEFIAVGILKDDLDEELLKATVRGNMCNLVDDARKLIFELRKTHPKAFENLVLLYERWRDDDACDPMGNPSERPIGPI